MGPAWPWDSSCVDYPFSPQRPTWTHSASACWGGSCCQNFLGWSRQQSELGLAARQCVAVYRVAQHAWRSMVPTRDHSDHRAGLMVPVHGELGEDCSQTQWLLVQFVRPCQMQLLPDPAAPAW